MEVLLRAPSLSDDDRRAILGGNAEKLLGISDVDGFSEATHSG